MRRIAIAVAVCSIAFSWSLTGSFAAEPTTNEAERVLWKTVNQLRAKIKRLEAENRILKAEKDRLKRRRVEQGVAEPKATDGDAAKGAPAKPGVYMCRDRKRSQAWFDGKYREYADGIALSDGKYVDIRVDRVNGRSLTSPVGKYCQITGGCEVLQVLGKTELLVRRRGTPSQTYARGHGFVPGMNELLFHVRTASTKGLVGGADFKAGLVRNGTYSYRSTQGARKTIESYVVYKPLSKQQFADALAKGFVLTKLRLVRVNLHKKKSNWAKGVVLKKGKYYKVVSSPEL